MGGQSHGNSLLPVSSSFDLHLKSVAANDGNNIFCNTLTQAAPPPLDLRLRSVAAHDDYNIFSNTLTGCFPAPYLCASGQWQQWVKYGVRSPKFIWAPCVQLHSLADPHLPSHLGSYIRGTRALLVGQDRRHLVVTLTD